MRMSAWVPRVLLAIAIVAIGWAIVSLAVGEGGPEPQEIGGVNDVQRIYGGIPQDGAYIGEEEAPVTVTVFNDIQCADCAGYQIEEIDPLVEELVRPGDIRLEFIHISTTQRQFTLAGRAAAAAGLQDRGWQYIDTFVRNFGIFGQTVDDEELREVADAIPQFEIEEWDADFESEESQQVIDADAQLAIDLGLGDVPGVRVEGPGGTRDLFETPPREEIERAIDAVG